MLGPLWPTGLLLSFFTICTTLDAECVLGVVGQPLSLPCFYPDAVTFDSASVEWWRNDEVVLRSTWIGEGHEEYEVRDSVTMSADARTTGNFNLELSMVDPQEDNTSYSLLFTSPGSPSVQVCTLCLRVAAPFSPPVLHWEAPGEEDDESVFLCHSAGGFPEPAVHWLVDGGAPVAPGGSVRTLVGLLPGSRLYNVTSYLTINISDANVSCIIENPPMNETLTSTTHAVWSGPVVSRATEAMWMFSTALCVVVGIMVAVGLGYQIHLDRLSKKKKMEHLRRSSREHNRTRQETEETVMMSMQSWETNV
ncbi:ICOS ligand-like [Dunckerocampus dactyliophorus]|uniref:ICOS ligand-like n=1 Tax=Dunckerocampus dactyliophorus TaxID=161453 RepID=UPI002406E64D|nr:ICOS ligand-like [Dunckerocampus dactyliophorus]